MTVASETNRSGPYNGNGVTTVFSYGFRILDQDHLRVVQTSALGVETILTIATHYTVSGVGNPAGGSVTALSAPATGETITILRAVPFVQETDLENQGAYYAETVEDALDLAAMRDQQLSEELDRSLRVPASVSGVSLELPTPEAGKIISWNEAADGLQNLSTAELSSVVSYGTANADIFTGDGATTIFALSANPAAINNLDVAIGGVTQLPVTDYTWVSGTNITFTTAPANGVKILVRYMQALPQGSSDGAATSFIQSGAGAVLRTVQEELRERISVTQFGATGDGVTDDTAAINLAIASASGASATTIFFPPGVYKVTSSINITRGQITLRGDGQGATVIRVAADAVNVIKVQAAAPATLSNVMIADMQIDVAGGVTTTAGSGIYLENVIAATISNVTIGGHANSISILGCFNVLVDNIVISYGFAAHGGRSGIYVTKASAPYGSTVSANIFINGVTATGGGNAADSVAPGAAYGMYVDCVDGLWVDNSYFGYFDQASIYAVLAGNMMSGLKFSNVWLDNGRNYGLWMNGSSGTPGASEFSSLRMVGGTNCVFNAYITGGWGNVHFVGGHAEQANDHCVAVTATGSDITFTGFDVDAPTTRTNKSGMFFNGPSNVRVIGCSIDGGAVGSTLYGVYINGGTGHIVSSNMFKNCAIAGYIDGSADYWTAIGNVDGTNTNTFPVTNNSTGTRFFLANIGRQSTGYGTPTGAAKVANFPGATATLVQCSNMIAQIVSELKDRGIFAA